MSERIEPPWEDLDLGIRATVRALWNMGFNPTDSGDGSKIGEMGCAIDLPHVYMSVSAELMVSEAKRLNEVVHIWTKQGKWKGLPGEAPTIQATYCPEDDCAILEIYGQYGDLPS